MSPRLEIPALYERSPSLAGQKHSRRAQHMNTIAKILGLVFLCATFAYGATDATISGTVKDPAGAPFKGAFVQAQNIKTRICVNVLSDKQGSYRILGLKPGEY